MGIVVNAYNVLSIVVPLMLKAYVAQLKILCRISLRENDGQYSRI
ncbi:hypothetical protein MCEMSEM29_02028 [Methylophilaceae bacterium]|jgi:hypothetical protein